MKDKLEPNMYVRTKWGYICKIININDFREPSMKYGVEASYLKDIMFIGDDVILKASHNIIDLIEERDYIRIITSAYFEPVYYSYGKLVIRDDIDISKYTNKFIAEVITHEQIEQMAYKVGE